MKPRRLTLPDLLKHLANEVQELGGQVRWAEAHGLTQGYIGNVLRGRRRPGPEILAALGYREVTVTHYEPVEDIGVRSKLKSRRSGQDI